MGLLTDEPSRPSDRGGEGAKFVALYLSMEPDDQALIRRWVEEGLPTTEVWRRISRAFDIGRSSIERGLPKVKALWES